MNIENSLHDINLLGNYYNEYLQQVDRYKNTVRSSIFCRYLSINKDASSFHEDMKGTFDRHYSGIIYDNYEYTPAYVINQIINDSQEDTERTGRLFTSQSEIITFTIDKPSHNDLVLFPYHPNNPEGEIFRVKEISVSLNSINKNIKYSKLGLERAPIKQNELKYLNSYVYLMTKEIYVPKDKYLMIIEEYNKINELFQVLKKYFDPISELYFYNYNGFKIAPLKQNEIIYNFLALLKHNERYFNNIKIPFGIKNFKNISDSDGYDLLKNKKIEMNGNNNSIILKYEQFINEMIFKLKPWNIQYYYFIDGRPTFGDGLPKEYSQNIINYILIENTLLMDLGSILFYFKG